jgi:hypothetical protein
VQYARTQMRGEEEEERQGAAITSRGEGSAGSRAPIRGPLPLLGSATGSQGSLRRMSHEKTPLTSSQCNAHKFNRAAGVSG